eukprot:scaffold2045_cov203-Alexandrium_tamarense.AAC.32
MLHKVKVILLLLICCVSFVVAAADGTSTSSASTPFTPPSNIRPPFYPQGRDRPHDYTIVNDEVRYSGWRKVIRRTVSSPIRHHPHHYDTYDRQHKTIEFDVIDQNHDTNGAVIIFAWNSTSKTATIVREYMPGCHRVLGGLAAGLVENAKHASGDGEIEEDSLVAARFELEEECHLAGGKWFRLTENGVSSEYL